MHLNATYLARNTTDAYDELDWAGRIESFNLAKWERNSPGRTDRIFAPFFFSEQVQNWGNEVITAFITFR